MIYHIYANRSNIGDWLSAKGIQKLLAPLEVTECYCDEPFVQETIEVLSAATARDFILIGGGGLLMNYFIPFWKAFQPIAQRVPFGIWGIGYCDNKHEPSLPPHDLIENIINRSKLCVVRDELTRFHLSRCQLPSPVPCPSINVVAPLLERGNGLLHVVNYNIAGADTYERMCAAAKTFAKDTGRMYRQTNNRINKGSEKEMLETLLLYQKSDIVISSALHGCIIGVAMGLKVLAVSGDNKIDSFMEAVGLKDWVLDVSEVDLVPKRLAELQSQVVPTAMLKEIREKNEEVAENILRIIRRNRPNPAMRPQHS